MFNAIKFTILLTPIGALDAVAIKARLINKEFVDVVLIEGF